MSRVYNEDIIKTFESCVFFRFKNKKELKDYLDTILLKHDLRVKELAHKSYYDSTDESDWEMLVTIGTNSKDIYDLTIYYAKTRIKENIIVEMGYEEV